MHILGKLALVSIFCLSTSVAWAQDSTLAEDGHYTPYAIPRGTPCVVDGERFQCFNLEEYKTLLYLDAELRYLIEDRSNLVRKLDRYEHIITNLNLALDAASQQVDILQVERFRLLDKWKEENRLRLEAENRPMLGSWLAWGIAATEGVVLATLIVTALIGGI